MFGVFDVLGRLGGLGGQAGRRPIICLLWARAGLIAVLRQMGASHIDFIADPESLTLHAYVIDTMGVDAAGATATLDRLSYLEFQGRA